MSSVGSTQILGILNVTPDSFSDGGNFVDSGKAIAHAQQMRAEGAHWIDVGGESTRPGSKAIELETEWNRIEAVLQKLLELGIPVSLDTRKAEIARRGIVLGVPLINDVSGGDDPNMLTLLAESKAKICLMHHQGDPETMQVNPSYMEVTSEVRSWLSERIEAFVSAGVDRERLIIDPGFGFGKSTKQNLDLLRNLREFRRLRAPMMVGLSRKSFIGRFLGTEENPAEIAQRLPATLIAQVTAVLHGADYVRTHDVAATSASLQMAQELALVSPSHRAD